MTKSSTKVLCLLALFSVAVLSSDVPDLSLTPVQDYDCSTVGALAKSVANDKIKLDDVIGNTIPAAKDVVAQCRTLIEKSYGYFKDATENGKFLQVNSGSSVSSDIAIAANKIQQQTAALAENEFTKAFNDKVSSLLEMTSSMKGSNEDIESLYQQVLAAFDELDKFITKCLNSYTNSLNNDITPRIKEYADFTDYCKNTVTVLGASYGDAGTKSKVQGFFDKSTGDETTFSCSNGVFGDPWKGVVKTCVVYYQVGDGQPAVSIVREGRTVSIKKSTYTTSGPLEVDSNGIQVIGCTYGLADTTKKCKSLVSSNGKTLRFKAENSVFTDTWDGTKKSFIIVYRVNGGDIQQTVVQEGDQVSISA